eukprot:365338-Chlamydomonas_euryale.AAC.22
MFRWDHGRVDGQADGRADVLTRKKRGGKGRCQAGAFTQEVDCPTSATTSATPTADPLTPISTLICQNLFAPPLCHT